MPPALAEPNVTALELMAAISVSSTSKSAPAEVAPIENARLALELMKETPTPPVSTSCTVAVSLASMTRSSAVTEIVPFAVDTMPSSPVASSSRVSAPAPASMIGSIASVPLPDSADGVYEQGLWVDPLHRDLVARGFEVPTMAWPAVPGRLLRISGQIYNAPEQYEQLAEVLGELLAAARA